jgi:hypothetical protein
MLQLRARSTGAVLHAPERYIDLSYRQRALAATG